MSQALKFAQCGAATTQLYVDDVFSAWLRSGTGASATVTTNSDLSTYGGLVWTKARSAATGNRLMHTAIGVGNKLVTDTTAASAAAAQGVTAISTTGHTIGTDTDYNNSTGPVTYVDWVFRNADKFYGHSVVTKSAGSNATVSFSNLGTLGMVRVKRTDSTGSWYVWHRSLTAGKLLIGETTAAEATLGHITVSGTTVTLVNGVIADGTYLVEAFAHDTSADGIIQCGSFTTDGSGNATVNLGWEPQYFSVKQSSGANPWEVWDSMRGMSMTSTARLYPNYSNAEESYDMVDVLATGLKIGSLASSQSFIYLAIRRPNKPPTSGTQVYSSTARNNSVGVSVATGFPLDLQILRARNIVNAHAFVSRLAGLTSKLLSSSSAAEDTSTLIESLGMDFFTMGSELGTSASIYHSFRRAPGVFDVVCYTGTGSNKTETHNLGVAPEFWIVKGRSGATAWAAGCTSLANTEYLVPNTTAAKATGATYWNSTFPTTTSLSLGTSGDVNTSTATYVAYLFATKAGISKVGSYTGNGTSQTINCGFSAGARFVFIKRTDNTGDWFVWDTARGIVAANDPHLSLNTTAAEVTTDDSIDPDNSGFIVNQDAATNINVNTATYIYLAFA